MPNRLLHTLLLCLTLLSGSPEALASGVADVQENAPATASSDAALRVFLNCDRGCFFDFIRQEIAYINWVRDRRDAQIHVLVYQERDFPFDDGTRLKDITRSLEVGGPVVKTLGEHWGPVSGHR